MVASLNLPMIVTENGVADDDDDMRPEHVRRHLQITSEAIADGHDILGFYHWSLMDNFEWAEGYEQCFGLYHVDFETQKRTLQVKWGIVRFHCKIAPYAASGHSCWRFRNPTW